MSEYEALLDENIASAGAGALFGVVHYAVDGAARAMSTSYDGITTGNGGRIGSSIGFPLGDDIGAYALTNETLYSHKGLHDNPGWAAGYLLATTGLATLESGLRGTEADPDEMYQQVREQD